MTEAGHVEVQRWSEEVARDPGSLAFLPLARAYRRQGQAEAALRLCLRGLEHHPTHIEAHAFLALLYLEAGDRQLACDEWSMVLRLDPGNFDAHRGMGFAYLERAELDPARRHLEQAAAARPGDPAVQEAMALVRERLEGRPAAAVPAQRDPNRAFEPLLADGAFLGALLLDAQGLVLASTFAATADARGRAEALGAAIGDAIEEIARTADHLALGGWRGILLETETATLHLTSLGNGLMVLVAAAHEAPLGWLLRTAARATELARNHLEQSP